MTDAQLNRMIADFLQIPVCEADSGILGDFPITELFRTHEEALLRELEILQKEKAVSITEICKNKINPATQEALTKSSAGEIRPFSESFPDQSRRIEKISHLEKPFYLHYLRNPKISPEIARTLRNYRKKEIRRRLKQ
ncbi:MAG: hypothetical protein QMD77_04230 [Patescibacteria group bacterium]|nr:hypothetical protein [Patescibacteria group bacterium]